MVVSFVAVEGVSIVFQTKDGPFTAVGEATFTVERGEFVSLIGHSGCGKTTLLNLIAGLLQPTRSRVLVAGRPVAGPGPDRAMVFQNHSLLPWMTCFDNVYLGVEHVFGSREPKSALRERVDRALALVRLESATQKYPYQISGGMKQRVGIARALAIEPSVLLLDEPFGALDALTRARLQDELMRIVAETRSTAIMVTHDIDEAVLLSDRIIMMNASAKGGSIGGILSVSLPRPRDRLALAKHADYLECRRRLLEFLYADHDDRKANGQGERRSAAGG